MWGFNAVCYELEIIVTLPLITEEAFVLKMNSKGFDIAITTVILIIIGCCCFNRAYIFCEKWVFRFFKEGTDPI